MPPLITIRGTGRALAERIVGNSDFPQELQTSDDWFRQRTGIRERRYAGPDETATTLGIAAARQALAAARLTPKDLDLIVCGTTTPDTTVPSCACRIQAALGCRSVAAFDVSAACTGFMVALGVGWHFLRGASGRNALVLGTEVLSRSLDISDRESCILFGDGAGAVVLGSGDASGGGVRSVKLYADGTRGDLIHVPSHVRNPAAPSHPFIQIRGRVVYRFAVEALVDLMRKVFAEHNLTAADVALLVPHQVNLRILAAACEELCFPLTKVMVNLDRYGNTGAASVPIALDEAIRGGRVRRGDTIVLAAFGGGLSWGSAVVTL